MTATDEHSCGEVGVVVQQQEASDRNNSRKTAAAVRVVFDPLGTTTYRVSARRSGAAGGRVSIPAAARRTTSGEAATSIGREGALMKTASRRRGGHQTGDGRHSRIGEEVKRQQMIGFDGQCSSEAGTGKPQRDDQLREKKDEPRVIERGRRNATTPVGANMKAGVEARIGSAVPSLISESWLSSSSGVGGLKASQTNAWRASATSWAGRGVP